MCLRHNTQRTPRSAARQNERDARQLDSPEHRRTPQQPNVSHSAIVPLALPTGNQLHGTVVQGDDPFLLPPPPPSLPPGPSPATARRQLDDLRAQVAAATALLVQPRGRRQRRAIQPPLPVPVPVPAPAPSPSGIFLHVNPYHQVCC